MKIVHLCIIYFDSFNYIKGKKERISGNLVHFFSYHILKNLNVNIFYEFQHKKILNKKKIKIFMRVSFLSLIF